MLRISPRRATKPPDRLMNRSPSGRPGLVSRLEFGERRRSAAFRRNTREERLPMSKKADAGTVEKALAVLTGRARIKRTMWSRRAQEYEAKINSGDIIAIAEVVRDLFRSESQPEQSYSERQLYEAALDRLAREVSAVRELTSTEAIAEIERQLAKGPRRALRAFSDQIGSEKALDSFVLSRFLTANRLVWFRCPQPGEPARRACVR